MHKIKYKSWMQQMHLYYVTSCALDVSAFRDHPFTKVTCLICCLPLIILL